MNVTTNVSECLGKSPDPDDLDEWFLPIWFGWVLAAVVWFFSLQQFSSFLKCGRKEYQWAVMSVFALATCESDWIFASFVLEGKMPHLTQYPPPSAYC